jgi:WD40 repeat protein
MSDDATTAAKRPVPTTDDRYKVGTLHYTKAGLVSVFGWMIMANLCFGLFEGNGGAGSIPFYLQDNFHISNTMISVLFNFIPMIIGTFMTPIISFWSDRTRSRLGRRIPYILYTAPFLVLFAILLGFSDDIIAACKVHFATSSTIAPLSAALFIIGFLTIGWSFFNEFVGCVYYYLLPDVMPRHFLGRFQGASQIAGTILGIAMNTWVAPLQLTHIKAIHVGVAILYFVGFGLVCWRVKEGQYPPVEDVDEETSFKDKVKLYFKECFNHPMYVMIYLVTAVTVLTRGLNPAGIFSLHIGQHQGTVVAHADVRDAVAATPDNAWKISGGQDGLIKVFQGPDRACQKAADFALSNGTYTCAALSAADNRLAVVREDNTIEVWDLAKGQRLQTLTVGPARITGLSLPNNGSQLAAAAEDQTIRIWEVRSGKLQKTLTGAANSVALAMNASGKVVASVSAAGEVQCWDVAKGKAGKSFTCRAGAAKGVAIANDGRTLVCLTADGTVEIWDVLDAPARKHQFKPADGVRDFALSGDARDLTLCSGTRVVTLDVASGTEIGALLLPAAADATVTLAPGGRRVASGTSRSALAVWQQPEKTFRLAKILSRHGDAIPCVAVNDAGRLVAVGTTNGTVELWDTTANAAVRTVSAHAGAVTAVALPGDGALLASAGADKTVKIWNAADGALLQTIPVEEPACSLAMTPDGKWLAFGARQTPVACWDVAGAKLRKSFPAKGDALQCLALAADGRTLATHAEEGPVELWAVADESRIPRHWYSGLVRTITFDRGGQDRLATFKADAGVKCLTLAADGGAVSISTERNVKTWSLPASRQTSLFSMRTASTSVAMSQDGRTAISGGKDGTLTVWDISKPKKPALVRTLRPLTGAPLAVEVAPDGKTAAAGSLSGAIDLWNLDSGACMLSLTGHTAFVSSVAFSRDGKRLVSASADRTVRIWDVASGRCVQTLAGHADDVNCAAFSSTGDKVVSGGSDRRIIVWDAASGAILKTLEGSPGPVYAVCFAPALGAAPSAQRHWFLATCSFVGNFLKNVFVNESLFAEPPDRTSRLRGEDQWVISGGRDGETDEVNSGVRIWDIEQGHLIPAVEDLKTKSMKGHKAAIVGVMYKPDIRVILSASLDESVRVWKPLDMTDEVTKKADDQAFRSFSGYTRGVTALSAQNDGKVMVNASVDGKLHVWDIDQGISLKKGSRYAANFFAILTLLLAYPVGALIDRLNPIKIVLWCTFLGLPAALIRYFFFTDYVSNFWINLVWMPVGMLNGMAALPMMVMLYPKTKYGQFSSANAMVKQFVGAFAGILGALLMDQLTNGSYDTDNYRYSYLFSFGVNTVSFLCLVGVFFYWKKLGGEHYVAPEADGKHHERAAAEAAAKAK